MPQRRRLWGKCAVCFYPQTAIKTGLSVVWDARLAPQNVDNQEDDDHRDGDPNRHLPNRAHSCRSPVQREALGPRKPVVAVPANVPLPQRAGEGWSNKPPFAGIVTAIYSSISATLISSFTT